MRVNSTVQVLRSRLRL